jgi:hypothetical protein
VFVGLGVEVIEQVVVELGRDLCQYARILLRVHL